MRWYLPSATGDFRLEQDGEYARLVVEDPTPVERAQLDTFLAAAGDKRWVRKGTTYTPTGRSEIDLLCSVADAGPVLAPLHMRDRGVLTAVRSSAGRLELVTTHVAEAAGAVAKAPDNEAVTVQRPTTCCPTPVEGPEVRSSHVLRRFCTEVQWAEWERHGYLHCRGGSTGIVYRLVHRNNPLALRQGKMAWDVTHNHVLHWWDWRVPPAEEVLAAKLILEHREPWLRNPNSLYDTANPQFVFANPLGAQRLQGTFDAGVHRLFGDPLGQGVVLLAEGMGNQSRRWCSGDDPWE